MSSAFSPGHITCFFAPAGDTSGDMLRRGSLGAGIRISLGAEVEVTERAGKGIHATMDMAEASLPVTESVISRLAPERGFDITIKNGLPCGQGFGMSAAGAIAVAMAVAGITGADRQTALEAAHMAEIEGGGGLGDVSAICCLAHQPVRVKEGIPPYGEVVGTPVSFRRLTLAVLGPKMNTGITLSDPAVFKAISEAGRKAVSDYMQAPSTGSLFSVSNRFSREAGVESGEVTQAIAELRAHGLRAGMCMLGNSIFTEATPEEFIEIIGEGSPVFECASTDSAPGIIRKA